MCVVCLSFVRGLRGEELDESTVCHATVNPTCKLTPLSPSSDSHKAATDVRVAPQPVMVYPICEYLPVVPGRGRLRLFRLLLINTAPPAFSYCKPLSFLPCTVLMAQVQPQPV